MKRIKLLCFLLTLLLLFTLNGCILKAGDPNEVSVPTEAAAVEGEVKIIDLPLTDADYVIAVAQENTDLLQKTNAYLAQIKNDGTLDAIILRHFGEGEAVAVASAEEDPAKDQLIVATDADTPAFSDVQGDQFTGIEMELAQGLAEYLGKELVIKDVADTTLPQRIADGEADLAISRLTADLETDETLAFSEPYYSAAQVVLTAADDNAFDECETAEDVLEILKDLSTDQKIGVQKYAVGMEFVEGSEAADEEEERKFEGFDAECVPYPNAVYAVENVLNGNVVCAITDYSAALVIEASFKDNAKAPEA